MTIPDPLLAPVMTYQDKVLQNAEIALKSGSTWVVAVFGLLGGIYASLSVAQQAQLVEQFPFLRGWAPIVTLVVAFVVAKLKPSNAVSTQTQALIDEIARLRLNVFLRARGSPELPTPPPTPLPVPAAVVAAPVPVATSPPVEPVLAPPDVPPQKPPPPVLTEHIDIPTFVRPAPAPTPPSLPIDPRLLLSLVQEYLAQAPPKPPASADAWTHL